MPETTPRKIHLAPEVREQLRLVFLSDEELVAALDGDAFEPLPHPPGCLRGQATLPVPRPLDPETAEMRRLEVYLRPVDGELEIFALRGLDLAGLG